MENWKSIKDFEGMYEVSDKGRVRSLPRETIYKDGRVGYHTGRILKTHFTPKGYERVDITKECKKYSKQIHRLVAEAFLDNPEGKEQVNHKDGVKTNNFASNLEWSTNEENILHANANNLRGSRQPKEIEQYDKDGNFVQSFRSIYQAAKAVDGKDSKISEVCRGKRHTHKGYVWRFAER